MILDELTAISPIDGRYRDKAAELAPLLSEFALIKHRVWVEVEYFIALCELPLPQLEAFPRARFDELRRIYGAFTPADALEVKRLERSTNHDVKAVEYFLKQAFQDMGLGQHKEFIHFGLTSQDVNNTANPIMLRAALEQVVLPHLDQVARQIGAMADELADTPMLARTHGQPASPTRLGKELRVFLERLQKQARKLRAIQHEGKFGGATGNLNAHAVAFPDIDWNAFADKFLLRLGLVRQQATTQVEHYDTLAETLDTLRRANTILIDYCRDIWTYVSLEYFRQRVKQGEVGSSAMPHKVNPIDFENAEGNLGLANALLAHLAQKLPISRLQRDLTDSTVLRALGTPLAHTLVALKSILKGNAKLLVNPEKIYQDLEANWAVVAEAIQTILRREGYPDPYEKLKELTRTGKPINQKTIAQFIQNLDVEDAIKEELVQISPHNYTGI